MHLTTAQRATLKTNILATPEANAFYAVGNLQGLADYYNANASPTFTVWKTNVPLGDVGKTFNATELAGLTQLNTSRLQNLAAWLAAGVNPSTAPTRQFFDDIFSGAGGAGTRAGLLALWKRPATRAEKLFATGTGSDASPATLVVEGALTFDEFSGL
jgi:hypothetical protein